MKLVEAFLLLVFGAVVFLAVTECVSSVRAARSVVKCDYVAKVVGVSRTGVPAAVSNVTEKVKSRNFLPVMLNVVKNSRNSERYDVTCGGVDASEFGWRKAVDSSEDEAR